MPLPAERGGERSQVNSLFACWRTQGRRGYLNPRLSWDTAALQLVPANPPRSIPHLQEGARQDFGAQECSSYTPLPSEETRGWGERGSSGICLPTAAPSPQHFVAVTASQDTAHSKGLAGGWFGAALGEVARPQEQPRFALLQPPAPALPKDSEQQGHRGGSTNPRGSATALTPVQSSPQAGGTVPSQLPCCGAIAPQCSRCSGLFPAGGSPRTLTAYRPDPAPGCLSFTLGEPSPHPSAGAQPCSGLGERKQPRP